MSSNSYEDISSAAIHNGQVQVDENPPVVVTPEEEKRLWNQAKTDNDPCPFTLDITDHSLTWPYLYPRASDGSMNSPPEFSSLSPSGSASSCSPPSGNKGAFPSLPSMSGSPDSGGNKETTANEARENGRKRNEPDFDSSPLSGLAAVACQTVGSSASLSPRLYSDSVLSPLSSPDSIFRRETITVSPSCPRPPVLPAPVSFSSTSGSDRETTIHDSCKHGRKRMEPPLDYSPLSGLATDALPGSNSRRDPLAEEHYNDSYKRICPGIVIAPETSSDAAEQREGDSFEKELETTEDSKEEVKEEDRDREYVGDWQVGDWDVYAERGGKGNNNPGNKRYLNLVYLAKLKYRMLEKKKDKTDLSMFIVEFIRSKGGRFLKKDKKGGYYAMSVKDSRDKVAQALREMKDEDEKAFFEQLQCWESPREPASE